MMFKRLFSSFSLVLLLLFAQQVALVHPYEHFSRDKQESSQHSKESPASSAFCEKCAAYAALGNAVSPSHVVLVLLGSPTSFFSESVHFHFISTTRYYAARAPPSTLV